MDCELSQVDARPHGLLARQQHDSHGIHTVLDGRAYHSSKLDQLHGGRRDLVLLRGGFRVLRPTWHHAFDGEAAVVAAPQELLPCAA